ncbi:hypothetical protein Efla_005212 [Eimeria flavescens]
MRPHSSSSSSSSGRRRGGAGPRGSLKVGPLEGGGERLRCSGSGGGNSSSNSSSSKSSSNSNSSSSGNSSSSSRLRMGRSGSLECWPFEREEPESAASPLSVCCSLLSAFDRDSYGWRRWQQLTSQSELAS